MTLSILQSVFGLLGHRLIEPVLPFVQANHSLPIGTELEMARSFSPHANSPLPGILPSLANARPHNRCRRCGWLRRDGWNRDRFQGNARQVCCGAYNREQGKYHLWPIRQNDCPLSRLKLILELPSREPWNHVMPNSFVARVIHSMYKAPP